MTDVKVGVWLRDALHVRRKEGPVTVGLRHAAQTQAHAVHTAFDVSTIPTDCSLDAYGDQSMLQHTCECQEPER